MSPDRHWLRITVNTLTAIVIELAVAERVFERTRVVSMKSCNTTVQHAQRVHSQSRFRLKQHTFPTAAP